MLRGRTIMFHRARQASADGGFTLIELLVAIAIIALLVSIALPALSQARTTGAQMREAAALSQHTVAFTVYAQDNRSSLLPGYAASEWVAAPPAGDPAHELAVFFTDTAGGGAQARLYGTAARRYTWRLAPYLGYAIDAIVLDKSLRSEFRALPDRPLTRDGFQWAVATSPSFGLNSTYVGGDSRRGGFFPPALARWGKFYVTTIDEPRSPDKLLVFATARGSHPVSGTVVVPGRHRIEGPWQASRETSTIPTFTQWAATTGRFDASREPSTYGHVDFRYSTKALIGAFDGHVEAVGLDDLRDMRRWCNLAGSRDWRPGP